MGDLETLQEVRKQKCPLALAARPFQVIIAKINKFGTSLSYRGLTYFFEFRSHQFTVREKQFEAKISKFYHEHPLF